MHERGKRRRGGGVGWREMGGGGGDINHV